ncbi:hypothetical protein [Mycobacteroides chelonae]|uniref:hypothetical protein n=1 Tax=Mycobacteroides chelonae TaxID=1774 RepID=UPI001042527C|nr:hypothetical protein [Mycobacteroides chelonae]
MARKQSIVVTIGGAAGDITYGSDCRRLGTPAAAIAHGRTTLRHDNFAIAAIENHRIESVSYMGRHWCDRYRNAVVEQLAKPLLAASAP